MDLNLHSKFSAFKPNSQESLRQAQRDISNKKRL